jgi:3-methyladenine DNA glycosylase AlkD
MNAHACADDKGSAPPTSGSSPTKIAVQIRCVLKDGGSAEHAAGVQWFFKEEIKSHGWYTADLRRAAIRLRREVRKEQGLDFLVEVADHLFSGPVLEEKIAAVFLLEKLDAEFGDREFKLFESWLDRISTWADHDALVHSLIAPMVASKPERARIVFRWAQSPNRWHRRAACVALIQGTRQKMFLVQITRCQTCCSPTRTTWSKKASAGCCEKRQRPIQREPFLI